MYYFPPVYNIPCTELEAQSNTVTLKQAFFTVIKLQKQLYCDTVHCDTKYYDQ